jgi:hypothetical protein
VIDMNRLESDEKTIFTILLDGLLTQQEYEVFNSHFESEIRQHKTLRLVLEMAGGLRWEPRSRWRDLKLDSNHHTNISKIAIIGGDQVWRDWAQKAFSPLKAESICRFSLAQKPLAITWIDR